VGELLVAHLRVGAALHVVLIGDGPRQDEVRGLIGRLGLDGHVTVDPGRSDARATYAAMDIVVQASDTEGLPNAVLEAAAAGRPIVATAVGGTVEILTDEADALLVPRRDRAALGTAILRLADDADLRARLAAAASRRAEAFSVARLVEQTALMYRSMLDAAGGPHRFRRRLTGADGPASMASDQDGGQRR
jgi:glycosyltransferase involved in cell wall biosynthesis